MAIIIGITGKNLVGWFLEFLPLIIVILILVFTINKFRFSNISYLLMFIFFLFPIIGAHYTYSHVPFEFLNALFLSPGRNNFDRFVHFSAGLILAFPVFEIIKRRTRLKGSMWLFIFAFSSFLAVSAAYEIAEWITAVFLSPSNLESFIGAQGDIWDAQKDMLMTAIGSFISLIAIILINRIKKIKNKTL